MKILLSLEYSGLLWLFLISISAGQPCNWPPELVGTWRDSKKGEVTFAGSIMNGWTFEMDPNLPGGAMQVRSEWECVSVDQFLSDGYLMMKATETITLLFRLLTVYRCTQMTKITDHSYRYYQLEQPRLKYSRCPCIDYAPQEYAGYERLTVIESTTETNVTVLCDHTRGASGTEFQVMISTGNETAATIRCPYFMLSVYDYVHTTAGGVTTCGASAGSFDMCQNTSMVTLDYASCSTKVAYSVSNTVSCVDSVPAGDTNAVMLYNLQDTDGDIDNVDVFRFSCMVVNSENTRASIAPEHCTANQQPNSVPMGLNARAVGATMTWTKTSQDCPPCPLLDNPLSGSVNISTDGASTLAQYGCEQDHDLYGAATRECLVSGAWEPAAEPSCTCNPPDVPNNGAITMATDGNITTTYTCDTDFVLVGNSERTCDINTNTWTGTDPTCDQCASLPSVPNGDVTVNTIGVTSVATYTCPVRYTLDGPSERTCQTDTSWIGTDPTCVRCETLVSPHSATVYYNTTGAVTAAVFSCAPEYTLVGSILIKCTATGSWDTTKPKCVCDHPGVPANGSIRISTDGATATYSCDLYFTIDGPARRTCGTDGTWWSGADPPVCVECPTKAVPPNGNVAVSTDGTTTSARYTCALNNSMAGQHTSRCLANGTWQYTDPVCNLCGSVTVPERGSVDLATDGRTTSAVYSCNTGSTISGNHDPYCLPNGTWTADIVALTCVLCPTITDNAHGTHTLSSNNTHTTATISCMSGYQLAGTPSTICDSDGSWDNLDQTCVGDDGSSASSFMPAVIALSIVGVLLIIGLIISFTCGMRWFKKAKQTQHIKKAVKEYSPPQVSSDDQRETGGAASVRSIPVAAVTPQNSTVGKWQTMKSFISSKTPTFSRSNTRDRTNVSLSSRISRTPMSSPVRTAYSATSRSVASAGDVEFDTISETDGSSIEWDDSRTASVATTVRSQGSAGLRTPSVAGLRTPSVVGLRKPSVAGRLALVTQTTDSSVELNKPAPWKVSPGLRKATKGRIKDFIHKKKSPAKVTFDVASSSIKYTPEQLEQPEQPEQWDISQPESPKIADRIKQEAEKRQRAAQPLTKHHKMKVLDEKTMRTPRSGIITVRD